MKDYACFVEFDSLVAYRFGFYDDTILHMPKRQIIALAAGAVATLTVFIAAMTLLIYSEYVSSAERLFFVSIALAPVAMVSVMVGYAVWWFVLFVLSLVLPSRNDHQSG
jgi:hypothetical protein